MVDAQDPQRLIGVVTRQSMIGAYNSEVLKRDAVSEVLGGFSAATESKPVLLSDGIALAEVEAPGWMVGETLVTLNLRRTQGIQVLMIHPSDGNQGVTKPHVPEPDYTITLGDNLVVLGPVEAIQRLYR
ncbi:MAG: TrkA C-terminal domain-containing protein [Planctomycetes bacterium]|nr:TrkA C-terminal domain-containing protein [Planctomycetota bacterium]